MSIDIIVIYNYLNSHNVKQTKGFRFLMTAIGICIEHPENCKKSKVIYKNVAEMFETTELNVYQSIRYAITGTGLSNKQFILKAIQDLSSNKSIRTAALVNRKDGKQKTKEKKT